MLSSFLFEQSLSTEVAEAYNVIPNMVSNDYWTYLIWYMYMIS
jgi:hypothetical protein